MGPMPPGTRLRRWVVWLNAKRKERGYLTAIGTAVVLVWGVIAAAILSCFLPLLMAIVWIAPTTPVIDLSASATAPDLDPFL